MRDPDPAIISCDDRRPEWPGFRRLAGLFLLAGGILVAGGPTQGQERPAVRDTGVAKTPTDRCPPIMRSKMAAKSWPESCGTGRPPPSLMPAGGLTGLWDIEAPGNPFFEEILVAVSRSHCAVGYHAATGQLCVAGSARKNGKTYYSTINPSLMASGDGRLKIHLATGGFSGRVKFWVEGQVAGNPDVLAGTWEYGRKKPKRGKAVMRRRPAATLTSVVIGKAGPDKKTDRFALEARPGRIERRHPVTCGAGRSRANCDSVTITIEGENLAGAHDVWIDPASHMEIRDAGWICRDGKRRDYQAGWTKCGGTARAGDGVAALTLKLVMWDGIAPGIRTLWVNGRPIPLHLVIHGHPAQAAADTRRPKWFIWTRRVPSDNWHAGIAITNWKDEHGEPRETWPGRAGDELVRIDNASVVLDKQPADIYLLTASGSLAIQKPLTLSTGHIGDGLLAANLTIKSRLHVLGSIDWRGGKIDADGRRDAAFGGLAIGTSGRLDLSYAAKGGTKTLRLHEGLVNRGTVGQGPGGLSIVSGVGKPVQLQIEKGATYRLTPGATVTTRTPAVVRIVNRGTLAVAAGPEKPVVIDPPLIQDGGKLVLGAGALTLRNGAEFRSGSIAGNGGLAFDGGTVTIKQRLAIPKSSRLILSRGTVLIPDEGGLTVASNGVGFEMRGGAIRASGPIELRSNWLWTGGSIATSARLTNYGTGRIGGGPQRRLDGTLENHGTIVQDSGGAFTLRKGSAIRNFETWRLNGSLTGNAKSSFTNEGDLRLGPGASLRMAGPFSNDGEITLSNGAKMKLDGGLKELQEHFGNIPRAYPGLPGEALVLKNGGWTLGDGASIDIVGPRGFTNILVIGEAATVTLSGSGRINNMPQPPGNLEKDFLNFGYLVLRDNAKWTSGKFRQLGSLYIDKTSSMRIETGLISGTKSFISQSITVIDGKLEVTNARGTELDDNLIQISGKLSGSGTINGKPVSAFGGTVTKPLD